MRNSFGILLGFVVVVGFSAHVFAERAEADGVNNIASAMEGVEWGWSHPKLIRHFTGRLQRLYRPVLNKATDALTEDRLRRQMNARISRIKNSYVEFRGQRTGWDTSLIRDQYTHNNGEAMVEVRELRAGGQDPRYTDYFFFMNGRLWRRFRAFNQDQFAGIAFETAAASFQRRFGTAREIRGANKALKALEWQDQTTSLRAIDNTEFFGVFCLVFSEKATESRLVELRKNQGNGKRRYSPIVEALDSEIDDTSRRHDDVVEHITGKRYNTRKSQDSR
jgi:hypothetical protein